MRSKIGRRAFMVRSATATGAAVLAACTQAGPGSAPGAAVEPIQPGESIGTSQELTEPTSAQSDGRLPTPREETYVQHRGTQPQTVFDNFNPLLEPVWGPTYAWGVVQGLMEMPFYANYAGGAVEPWLATSWEYNDDFTRCTFQMREGVTWNDGEPITAHDWAFTAQLQLSDPIVRGQSSLIEEIAEVSAIDDFTVEFGLKKSLPRFHMRAWATPIASSLLILPQHIWEGQNVTDFRFTPPVGSGPFRLLDTYPDQNMFVWERRDDYWYKDEYFPPMKYAIYMTAPSGEAAYAALGRDEADASSLEYPLAQRLVEEYPDWEMSIFQDPCPRAVMFNCEKVSDPVVRWAIQYCTNSEKLAGTVWQPPTVRATAPWARYAFMEKWYVPEVLDEQYKLEFNPEKAVQMLEEAGYVMGDDGIRAKDGVKLQFTATTPALVGQGEHAILTDIAEECQKIGIDVNVQRFEFPVWQEGWLRGEPDFVAFWMCGPVPNVLEAYRPFHSKFFVPVGELSQWANYPTRLQDPELDAAIDEFEVATPDAPEALDLNARCLELMMKNLPAYPVVETQYFKLFNNKFWTGWPNKGNFYTPPADWWGTYRLVLYNLEQA